MSGRFNLRRVRSLAASVLVLCCVAVTASVVTPGAHAAVEATEWEFFRDINNERTSRGLPALHMNPGTADASAAWSASMRSAGGISHDPNLGSRTSASCQCYWTGVGENVGVGYGTASLHALFMSSPDHRDNILDSRWKYVGVGVVTDSGSGRMYVTVRFYKTADSQPVVRDPGAGTATTASAMVSGDFDGNGIGETFAYKSGSSVDRIYNGRTSRGLTRQTPQNVLGVYQPLSGDFDGNGRDDIFWYAPGGAADSIWNGTGTHGSFSGSAATNVSGSYKPFTGDFNGDGRGDIYWYAPGSSPDYLWYGTSSPGSFTSVAKHVSGTYKPFTGDFNGDGRDDIFWYAPGGAADYLWSGTSTRGAFTQNQLSVSGTYDPMAGDFNGDGRDDIFWYAPGGAADYVWAGSPTRGSFSSSQVSVNGTYTPSVEDFDRDGKDDVLFGNVNTTSWYLWYGSSRSGAFTSVNVSG